MFFIMELKLHDEYYYIIITHRLYKCRIFCILFDTIPEM